MSACLRCEAFGWCPLGFVQREPQACMHACAWASLCNEWCNECEKLTKAGNKSKEKARQSPQNEGSKVWRCVELFACLAGSINIRELEIQQMGCWSSEMFVSFLHLFSQYISTLQLQLRPRKESVPEVLADFRAFPLFRRAR